MPAAAAAAARRMWLPSSALSLRRCDAPAPFAASLMRRPMACGGRGGRGAGRGCAGGWSASPGASVRSEPPRRGGQPWDEGITAVRNQETLAPAMAPHRVDFVQVALRRGRRRAVGAGGRGAQRRGGLSAGQERGGGRWARGRACRGGALQRARRATLETTLGALPPGSARPWEGTHPARGRTGHAARRGYAVLRKSQHDAPRPRIQEFWSSGSSEKYP